MTHGRVISPRRNLRLLALIAEALQARAGSRDHKGPGCGRKGREFGLEALTLGVFGLRVLSPLALLLLTEEAQVLKLIVEWGPSIFQMSAVPGLHSSRIPANHSGLELLSTEWMIPFPGEAGNILSHYSVPEKLALYSMGFQNQTLTIWLQVLRRLTF